MALSVELVGLVGRESVEGLLVGRAVVQVGLGDISQDDEKAGAERNGQAGRGEILEGE